MRIVDQEVLSRPRPRASHPELYRKWTHAAQSRGVRDRHDIIRPVEIQAQGVRFASLGHRTERRQGAVGGPAGRSAMIQFGLGIKNRVRRRSRVAGITLLEAPVAYRAGKGMADGVSKRRQG